MYKYKIVSLFYLYYFNVLSFILSLLLSMILFFCCLCHIKSFKGPHFASLWLVKLGFSNCHSLANMPICMSKLAQKLIESNFL